MSLLIAILNPPTTFTASGTHTGHTGAGVVKERFKIAAAGTQSRPTGAGVVKERFKVAAAGTQTGHSGAAALTVSVAVQVQYTGRWVPFWPPPLQFHAAARGQQSGHAGRAALRLTGRASCRGAQGGARGGARINQDDLTGITLALLS